MHALLRPHGKLTGLDQRVPFACADRDRGDFWYLSTAHATYVMRPPPLRLVILLEDLADGDSQRHAGQLLQYIDRSWFAPELWVLGGGGKLLPALCTANSNVVDLSDGRRAGLPALARLAARLWRCRPDVLYILPAPVPSIWGPLIAGVLGISVVANYRDFATRPYAGVLKRFASRIITNAESTKDRITQQRGMEPDQVAVIASGVVRQTENILREVAQRGTAWTTTADGEIPLELPLWPQPAKAAHAEKIIERGRFHPDRSLRQVSLATLTIHLPAAESATGAAAVICPGGGYAALSIDKEGHDVARRLATLGIAGLVLKYRLPRADLTGLETPWPLQDIVRALGMARDHAGEWGIDPQRLGVMGFSAGGHMAAAASNAGHRLAFAALIYPVISMQPKLTHKGSRQQLLGARPVANLTKRYSFENLVTARTSPTFLVHARDDDVVKVENSIVYADALRRAGVAHEFLLYEQGGHGFGLGKGSEVSGWTDRFAGWLSTLEGLKG